MSVLHASLCVCVCFCLCKFIITKNDAHNYENMTSSQACIVMVSIIIIPCASNHSTCMTTTHD